MYDYDFPAQKEAITIAIASSKVCENLAFMR